MRRGRDIREYRESLRKKSIVQRESLRRTKLNQSKFPVLAIRKQRNLKGGRQHPSLASVPWDFSFKDYDQYQYTSKEPVKVCHVIESLGLGGGQVMMLELVNGLRKYFGEHCLNTIVALRNQKYDRSLYNCYDLAPIIMHEKDLHLFLKRGGYHIVLHHRLAISNCVKQSLPKTVKYVLLNHTFHQLPRIPSFRQCDAYVSVCKFLNNKTRWMPFVHPSRRLVILNGIDNSLSDSIEPKKELVAEFITGRCHRLAHGKFDIKSLTWLDEKGKNLPGHRHYLIGNNIEARKLCSKLLVPRYLGPIYDRREKVSVLKTFDMYFYDTFQDEGASIAVLEALSLGIPVLCKNFGGNEELITHEKNGFILDDREHFLPKMVHYYKNRDELSALKADVLKDFNERLHIKYVASKYLQLFEALMNVEIPL